MTGKQKLYCEGLAVYNNGYKAAIEAGYSHQVARKKSFKWVGNSRPESEYPEMYDYWLECLAKERVKIAEKYHVDKAYLKSVIKPILDAKIDDYIKWDGTKMTLKPFDELTADQLSAIESMKMGRYGVEFKLHGKSWSSDSIAKHTGFYEEDNKQKEGKSKVLIEMPNNTRGRVVAVEAGESTKKEGK